MSDRFSKLGYVTNPLDRRGDLRDRPEALAALRAQADAGVLVFAGDVSLLKRQGDALEGLFAPHEVAALGTTRATLFLGLDGTRPLFADEIEPEAAERFADDARVMVIDARSIAVQGLLPASLIGPLAEAKALLHWHRKHCFCASCGAPSRVSSAGWKRICDACETEHFPRTDPVVIMLSVRGDKCVLGRQSRFPPGMYSCLAGFLEPGETIEAAVRRETLEEAGVRTGQVRYLASQPWPFPASLMIGCIAEALNDYLTIDGEELEHARWFTRDEVRLMLDGQHPDGLLAPQPMAIANALLKSWVLDGVGV
ncbi:MAG: NAD(+) diphosphatase [Alphaproteobacteria bacterium]|nr:NAD(+) diphosphatase [Alphaproteobacteria bacterium]